MCINICIDDNKHEILVEDNILAIRHKKSAESSVVYSTYQGSSIAYLSRTDNVRAHADMKIITVKRLYITHLIAPDRVQSMLTVS